MGQVWKSKHCCLYCGKDVLNFARHLYRIHKDKAIVQQFSKFPVGSLHRKRIIDTLRKEGNFMSVKKEIRLVQRPHRPFKPENVVVCVGCKGLYLKSSFRRHKRSCFNRPKVTRKRPLHETHAETHKKAIGYLRFDEKILNMKCDSASLVVKFDILILSFGSFYIKGLKHTVVKNSVSGLVRVFQDMKHNIQDKDMLEALKPQNFKYFVSSTQNLERKNGCTGIFEKSASFAHLMQRTLIKLCQYAYSQIQNKNPVFTTGRNCLQKLDDIKKLQALIEEHWWREIEQQVTCARFLEATLLRLTRDVIKFKRYVEEEAKKLAAKLRINQDDRTTFLRLQSCCYALLLVLNNCPSLELEELKLFNYLHREPVELEESFKESEIIFEKTYKRFCIKNKREKIISLLFSQDLLDYIDLFLSCRNRFIPDMNSFLFAALDGAFCLNGCISVEMLASEAGVEKWRNLISNKYRKPVAMIFQIAVLNSKELDELCLLLDYTLPSSPVEGISREVYQIASLTKVMLSDEIIPIEFNDTDEIGESCNYNESSIERSSQSMQQKECKTEPMEIVNEDIDIKPLTKRDFMSKSKVKWTTEQKQITVQYFNENIQNSKPPTKSEIEVFKALYSCMNNKNWKKIKAFVFNEYSKIAFLENKNNIWLNEQVADNHDSAAFGSFSKIRWTTEQKQVTVEYFQNNIRHNKPPTESEVEAFKKIYSCMDNKDWKKIKAFVFNQYNKSPKRRNLF